MDDARRSPAIHGADAARDDHRGWHLGDQAQPDRRAAPRPAARPTHLEVTRWFIKSKGTNSWTSVARRPSSSAAHRAWLEASAEQLKAKGASIAILDLPTSAGAEVAKELGGIFHPLDVLDTDRTEQALARTRSRRSAGLHIAVNTAGGGIGKRTLTKEGPHPLEEFRKVIDLNLIATFQLNRLQANYMSAERAGGRRARRHHQHRVDRGVRGPDRPGRLCRREVRHRRHDFHDGA